MTPNTFRSYNLTTPHIIEGYFLYFNQSPHFEIRIPKKINVVKTYYLICNN